MRQGMKTASTDGRRKEQGDDGSPLEPPEPVAP